MSLDVKKAFDRVNWCYPLNVLTRFGLQGSIFQAIMSLYTAPSASVFVSGFLSSSFIITNGTRQGCPLSPLVFALCIEPLASYIRLSHDVSGITIGTTEHNIGLYADDVILKCSSPEKSFPALISILEEYSSISFYKLNMSKSSILPLTTLTTLRHSLTPFNFNWVDTHLSYLGIELTLSPSTTIEMNMKKLIGQTEQEIKRLSSFPTSWMARINLCKMLLLPRYLYIISAIPYLVPPSYLTKLQNLHLKFIWNNAKPRFKKRYIFLKIKQGGLSVPDLALYNIAAILEPSYILWHHASLYRWSQLENSSVLAGSVKDHLTASLFGTSLPCSSLLSMTHLFVSTFLRIIFPDFSPSIWTQKGINSVDQFYSEDVFVQFKDVPSTSPIPKSYFFRYLQIRNALQKLKWP